MQNNNVKTLRTKASTLAQRQKRPWVTAVAKAIEQTQGSSESKVKTVLTCQTINNKNALFVPADMAELQPRSLQYLHKFAAANRLLLIEDRRSVNAKPIIEKRTQKDPMMILGMSMLLKQAGMPGPARKLSQPHRLKPENSFVPIASLIDMAAYSATKAKRILLPPNRITVKALDNDNQPIFGYACTIKTDDTTCLLSHFESDSLKAIGYSAGNQFVLHLCLGGGIMPHSRLWTNLNTLQSTDFRFQLFTGKTPAEDFGLFYATLYLDLSQAPYPSWTITKPAKNDATHRNENVA